MAHLRGVLEAGTAEVGYTVKSQQQGALLEMQLRGYWTPELARSYLADIRALGETPVVTRAAIVIGEAIRRGLMSIAFVTQNTLAKLQMQRISLQGGCQDVECFDDEASAKEWIQKVLAGAKE